MVRPLAFGPTGWDQVVLGEDAQHVRILEVLSRQAAATKRLDESMSLPKDSAPLAREYAARVWLRRGTLEIPLYVAVALLVVADVDRLLVGVGEPAHVGA